MLKVSPRKGIIQFGKRGKLNPRYIRPFKILEWIGLVAYKLELSKELNNVYITFHVSNLKKCLSDESIVIPMKELRLDEKLNFVKEPVEIMDQKIKQLKQSRIPIVKEASEDDDGVLDKPGLELSKEELKKSQGQMVFECSVEALGMERGVTAWIFGVSDVSDALPEGL
ncbi:hypothetical protein Tco_0045007 [Tanacetum coccineum]